VPTDTAAAARRELIALRWTAGDIAALDADWPHLGNMLGLHQDAIEYTRYLGLTPTEVRIWFQALYNPDGSDTAAHQRADATGAFEDTYALIRDYRNAASKGTRLAVTAMRAGLLPAELATRIAAGTADLTALETLAALASAEHGHLSPARPSATP